MADDIVTRLQDHPHTLVDRCECVRCEAAAEIERLRAEVERLEADQAVSDGIDKGKLLDEIARLRADLAAERAKVERLRAAGDALATNYEIMLNDRWSAFSAAFLAAWREARHAR